MCEIKMTGGPDLEITCSISNKPIKNTNEYGMYCDNYCGLEEDKKYKKMADEVITRFLAEHQF